MYDLDELPIFQNDLKLKNKVNIFLDGSSEGSLDNTFTYYGQLNYSKTEEIYLLKKTEIGAELVEKIVDIQMDDPSYVYSAKEYQVILLEKLTWNTPEEEERHAGLLIFCPESIKEE